MILDLMWKVMWNKMLLGPVFQKTWIGTNISNQKFQISQFFLLYRIYKNQTFLSNVVWSWWVVFNVSMRINVYKLNRIIPLIFQYLTKTQTPTWVLVNLFIKKSYNKLISTILNEFWNAKCFLVLLLFYLCHKI